LSVDREHRLVVGFFPAADAVPGPESVHAFGAAHLRVCHALRRALRPTLREPDPAKGPRGRRSARSAHASRRGPRRASRSRRSSGRHRGLLCAEREVSGPPDRSRCRRAVWSGGCDPKVWSEVAHWRPRRRACRRRRVCCRGGWRDSSPVPAAGPLPCWCSARWALSGRVGACAKVAHGGCSLMESLSLAFACPRARRRGATRRSPDGLCAGGASSAAVVDRALAVRFLHGRRLAARVPPLPRRIARLPRWACLGVRRVHGCLSAHRDPRQQRGRSASTSHIQSSAHARARGHPRDEREVVQPHGLGSSRPRRARRRAGWGRDHQGCTCR